VYSSAVEVDLASLVIDSARLQLRLVARADIDAIFEQFTPEVTRYMYPASPKHRGETELFVRESMEAASEGYAYRAAVHLRDCDRLIGMVGLEDVQAQVPTYGVWLGAAHHGHGYGREAVLALHDWARAHLHQPFVLYPVDRDNLPSRKIAEALGGHVACERAERSLGGRTLHLFEYHVPLR